MNIFKSSNQEKMGNESVRNRVRPSNIFPSYRKKMILTGTLTFILAIMVALSFISKKVNNYFDIVSLFAKDPVYTIMVHHYEQGTTTSLAADDLIEVEADGAFTAHASTTLIANHNVDDTNITIDPPVTLTTLNDAQYSVTGTITQNSTITYYYYQTPYDLYFYYDGVIDNNLTETRQHKIGGDINLSDLNATLTDTIHLKEGFALNSTATSEDDGELPLTISNNPDKNKIYAYYTTRTDLTYIVRYLDYETGEEITTPKTVTNQTYHAVINVADEILDKGDIDGYTYRESNPTSTLQIGVGTNEIDLYYDKRNDLRYTRNYYFFRNLLNDDDKRNVANYVIDPTLTYTSPANNKFNSSINFTNTEFDNQIKNQGVVGYEYKMANTLDNDGILPLVISTTEANNVINVYYTLIDELSFTVRYFVDGVDTNEPYITGDDYEYGDEIYPLDTQYDAFQPTGYKVDKFRVNGTDYPATYDEPLLTIGEISENNVIEVYYTKASYSYAIRHFYKKYGQTDNNATENTSYIETGTLLYQSQITESQVTKHIDTGYAYEKMVTTDNDQAMPLVISNNSVKNIIKVYYTPLPYNYTVHYFYNGVENTAEQQTVAAHYGDEITLSDINTTAQDYQFIEAKLSDGSTLSYNNPMVVTDDESTNVINVYFVGAVDYTINHRDAVDNSIIETDTLRGGVNTTISSDDVYKTNLNGYDYDAANPTSVTLGSDPSQNVMDIYYTRQDIIVNIVLRTYINEEHDYDPYDDIYISDFTAPFKSTITSISDLIDEDELSEYIETNINANIIYYDLDTTAANGLPLTVSYDSSANNIYLYFMPKKLNYTVYYYLKESLDATTQTLINTYVGQQRYNWFIDSYPDYSNGGVDYEYLGDESLVYNWVTDQAEPNGIPVADEPLVITNYEDENVIYVYYKAQTIDYTVHYYYNNVEDTTKEYTGADILGAEVLLSYLPDNSESGGYYIDTVNSTSFPYEIVAGTNDIYIYYLPDVFNYSIEYYLEDIEKDQEGHSTYTEDTSLKVTGLSGLYKSSVEADETFISNYVTSKIPEGFSTDINDCIILTNEEELFDDENNPYGVMPLTIGVNENVIRVYFDRREDLEYTINYIDVDTNEVINTQKVATQQPYGKLITRADEYIAIDGYDYNSCSTESFTIGTTAANNVMTIYYKKGTFDYTINYDYEDDNLDTSVTDTATFKDEISTYDTTKLIRGYELDSVTDINGNPVDVDNPLTITSNPDNNVINVTFKKKSYNYIVNYYFEKLDGTPELRDTVTLSAKYQTEITDVADLPHTGFERSSISVDNGNPLVIDAFEENETNPNVIDVHYSRISYQYKVNYYYQNQDDSYTKDDSLTFTDSKKYETPISTYTDHTKDGYVFDSAVLGSDGTDLSVTNPLVITNFESGETPNVINVYYNLRTDLTYTINFIDTNPDPDEIIESRTITNQKFNSVIDCTNLVETFAGYNYDHVENNTITITTSENVVNIYYTRKNDLTYTVNYYLKGSDPLVKVEESVVYENNTYKDVINALSEIININGYLYDSISTNELTISANSNNNVINIFYIKDTFNYEVHYLYENLLGGYDEDTSLTETLRAEYLTEISTHTDNLKTGFKQGQVTTLDGNDDDVLTISYDETKNVIYVRYDRESYGYEIRYIYNNEEDVSRRITGTAKYETQISNITEKDKDGYRYNETMTLANVPLIISTDPTANILNVYYDIRTDLTYTINYLEVGTDTQLLPQKIAYNQTFNTLITAANEAALVNIDGYVFDHGSVDSIYVSTNEANNEIDIYFKKGIFDYTVHYFYENVEDTTMMKTLQAEFKDKITTVPSGDKEGYSYSSDEHLPLTITSNPANNVINVYYIANYYSYTTKYLFEQDDGSYEEKTNHPAVVENAKFNTRITMFMGVYEEGYSFERVTPSENGTQVNLTITTNEQNNIITVYYDKNKIDYTIHFAYENGNGYIEDQTRTKTYNAKYGRNIDVSIELETDVTLQNLIDSNKVDGYQAGIARTTESATDTTLPLTISNNPNSNKIIVDYSKRTDLTYTVNYLERGTNRVLQDPKTVYNQKYETTIYTNTENTPITGYNCLGSTVNTIEITTGENVINIYYEKASFNYTVHYLYEDVEDTSKQEIGSALFESSVTTYIDKTIDGYELDRAKTGTVSLQISAVPANNNIYIYYKKAQIDYTIHYFFDGIEDATKVENKQALFESQVSTYTDYSSNVPTRYKLNSANTTTLPITITSNPNNNIINIYYDSYYQVSSEVVAHEERFVNGSSQQVLGGTVTHQTETVDYGQNCRNSIVITPSNSSYAIDKITIVGSKTGSANYLFSESDLDANNGLTIDASKLTNITEDKSIKVTFKKKSLVTIKYLAEENSVSLSDERVVTVYSGDEYSFPAKDIDNYNISTRGLTFNDTSYTPFAPNGIYPYADDNITLVYWYREAKDITVKHIAVNEKGEESLLEEEISENVQEGEQLTATRNSYDGYISASGNQSQSANNIIITNANQNSVDVTASADYGITVKFYYERQFSITTSYNADGGVINDENGNTKSTEYVLDRGNALHGFVIRPNNGWQIDSIKLNGENVAFTPAADKSFTISANNFQDVQENYNLVVSFKQIAARVIVNCIDTSSDENIYATNDAGENVATRIIAGYVNDNYTALANTFHGYQLAKRTQQEIDTLPTTGFMTEEDITITFYYDKIVEIITDVQEIEVNGVMVKGGTISGDDQENYEEIVLNDETENKNQKAIVITPYYGFRLSKVYANGSLVFNRIRTRGRTFNEDDLGADGSLTIPSGYFTDNSDNINVVAEFEQTPSYITVRYVDVATGNEIITTQEVGAHIGDNVTITPEDIPYYDVVREEGQTSGVINDEQVAVTYYYKKQVFNFKVSKAIEKITFGDQIIPVSNEDDVAKATIEIKGNTTKKIKITYNVTVTNAGKVLGRANLVEQIPAGTTFVSSESSREWIEEDGKITLTTDEIPQGEMRTYKVTVMLSDPDLGSSNVIRKESTSTINRTTTPSGFDETTLDDNVDMLKTEIDINFYKNEDLPDTGSKDSLPSGKLPQTSDSKINMLMKPMLLTLLFTTVASGINYVEQTKRIKLMLQLQKAEEETKKRRRNQK